MDVKTEKAADVQVLPEESKSRWLLLAVGLIVLILFVWWLLGWWLPQHYFGSTVSERGARGDAFGGVSALFSGLAFSGVIVAILMQRQELALQRMELRQTRDELRGQRQALEQQLRALDQQRFESTLFQMINLHHEIVRGIQIPIQGRAASDAPTGREALAKGPVKALWESLNRFAVKSDVRRDDDEAELLNGFKQVTEAYEKMYESYGLHIGHYLRNLYHIFKTIDLSGADDKQRFASLVRAQLSTPELQLLFYNCFVFGFEKFKPLVHRYDLLQNLPRGQTKKPGHWDLFERVHFDAVSGTPVVSPK